MIVRQPIYAGAHYFGDEGRLRASVDAWIEDATQPRLSDDARGLIVPRGLHREFGPTAGFAYKTLLTTPLRFDRVTLIAPNLSKPELAIACDPADGYETPLGIARVDGDLVLKLRANGLPIVDETDPEDVIESQLPFVQSAFGELDIVPLRIGAAPGCADALLDAAPELGFIVVSAKLAVGHETRIAQAVGAGAISPADLEKPKGLRALFARGDAPAWGADLETLAFGLRLLRRAGAGAVRVLKTAPGGLAAVAV
jgi:AmmeMemoRadiSam system protein B